MKYSLRHQSDGWLYPYIVPLGKTMYWAFFKKVYLNNRRVVPSDKPVLLAVNHPTAFMDPFLLCSYTDPPLYNMTRGDIFRIPVFRAFMESINMFPVYRVRDGYGERDRNAEVFDYCVGKLRDSRVVAIYVEGEHHLEKHVRPAQKGLARIAFAAYERHALDDLQVIPVGCNYVYGDRPRDEAMINYGTPLLIRDYWDEYRQSPGRAITRLGRDMEAQLKTLCYHIEDPADFALGEQLLTLHRSERPAPGWPSVVFDDPRRFAGEKAVCERLNTLSSAEKTTLRARMEPYFAQLTQANLSDEGLMNPRWGAWYYGLLWVVLFPLFVAGWISSQPVNQLSKWVARTKAKKREFFSSVYLAVGFVSGLFYYTGLLVAGLCTAHPLWIGVALLAAPMGWFALWYQEAFGRWREARRAAGHSSRAELLALRGQCTIYRDAAVSHVDPTWHD
jgi:glycerol-3-phosphate O-acyltransferase / dihydroxyacetone phosphate acyltransferase